MKRRRVALAPILLVCAALGATTLHARVPQPKRAELGSSFVPRPQVARLTAAGFHTAMADFYWLQAVQIVGSALRPQDHGSILGRYVDVVTTVDPWVGHPYRFGAVWLTNSREDVELANELLLRSFEYHPNEWRNRFYLGFNLFYYLDEPEQAAHWLAEAATMEGSPPYLGALSARLRVGKGGLVVAERMLREMVANTDDPRRIAKYEQALDEVETEKRARRIDKAREEYKRRHGRDIERLEDLYRGPRAVVRRLPPELHDFEWVLSEDSGEIVSSYYGHRYRPTVHDRETREHIYGWSIEGEREKTQEGQGAEREGSGS